MGKRLSIDASQVVSATAASSTFVLVCEKCGKRAGRRGLRSEIKAALKRRTGLPRMRVVATGCLGICPKGGIVISHAAALARGKVVVMGENSSVEEAIARLVLL